MSNYEAKLTKQFSQELTEGSGGDAPYTYAASPLPAGLTFDKITRYIEGTPTSATPMTTTVTYTVEDEDGDSVSAEFKITVYEYPSLDPVDDVAKMLDIPFELELPACKRRQRTLRLHSDR